MDDRKPFLRDRLWLVGSCGVLVALIGLQWNLGIVPLAGAYDSEWYLRMAQCIAEGRWLGPYDQMTLIRSPLYPAFIAKVVGLGLSLQNLQVWVDSGAVLLMAIALRVAGSSPLRVFGFILSAGFHPVLWMPVRFVATEALAQALITVTMASAIGMVGSVGRSGWAKWGWTVLFGIGLGGSFWVREEGIWLIPFCLALGWVILFVRFGNDVSGRSGIGRGERGAVPSFSVSGASLLLSRLGFVAIAGVLCLIALLVVRNRIVVQNAAHYGVSVTTEISEPEFRRAFQILTRLDVHRHHPYVPITREAMRTAAGVSERFGELMPCLVEQFDGSGWSKFGCEWMGICDEIAGGWMVWAFRDAASAAGKHADAVRARAFYGQMADQIEAACASGLIRCSANPTGTVLAPPLHVVDAFRILSSCGRVLWMALWMPGLEEGIAGLERIEVSSQLGRTYAWLKADRIGGEGGLLVRVGPRLVWVYRILHLIAVGWIAAMLVRMAVRRFSGKRRCVSGLTMTGAVWLLLGGGIVLSRTLLVAYIDAMSFWAQLRYMLPIYPALIGLVWWGKPVRGGSF